MVLNHQILHCSIRTFQRLRRLLRPRFQFVLEFLNLLPQISRYRSSVLSTAAGEDRKPVKGRFFGHIFLVPCPSFHDFRASLSPSLRVNATPHHWSLLALAFLALGNFLLFPLRVPYSKRGCGGTGVSP